MSARGRRSARNVGIREGVQGRLVRVLGVSMSRVEGVLLRRFMYRLHVLLIPNALHDAMDDRHASDHFAPFGLFNDQGDGHAIFLLVTAFSGVHGSQGVDVNIALNGREGRAQCLGARRREFFSIVVDLLFKVRRTSSRRARVHAALVRSFRDNGFRQLHLHGLVAKTITYPGKGR